jgi:Na+/H+ antiporter NhaA
MRKKTSRIFKVRVKKASRAFMEFFRQGVFSSILLLVSAAGAMFLANSPYAGFYENILHVKLVAGFGDYILSMSLLHWINDGLMAVFFFVVGMEIKREFLFGELKSLAATILPVAAALGGMAVPALLYLLFNFSEPTISGWAIPMSTDIAFAMGLLALAGNAPRAIAVFLTALAIVDDLGAILVVAFFYSGAMQWLGLFAGLLVFGLLITVSRYRQVPAPFYIAGGLLAWYGFLQAGIHPTVAGVLLGLVIPARGEAGLLEKLEHMLAPWSAYLIMPVFALANAGVSIDLAGLQELVSPLGLGILFGLCLGKPLGVLLAVYLLRQFNFVKIPKMVKWGHFAGAGVLAGIGFTMSLFIATLAFPDPQVLNTAKLSIVVASLLSGLVGLVLFRSIKSRLV